MNGFHPLQSASPLIVYLDLKSPYAFVAKDPTRALGRALGIDIDWRPLTLDIPSYAGSARLDEHDRVKESQRTPEQWTGIRYSYRDARRYARLLGYTLRGTVKIWDTSAAHIAMAWAKDQGERVLGRYLDDFYERFWRRELDAEDPAVLKALLAEAGAELDGFDDYLAGPGRERHDTEQAAIFEAGIFGVPTYVAAGEVWFGREHLPRVRWLLEGRPRPAPDAAYAPVAGGRR